MAFGGATKKLQKLADTAEQLYERINELREEIEGMRETLRDTHDRVSALEGEVSEQRALLEALAEREGVDVEAAYAEAAIGEAEPPDDTAEASPPADEAPGERDGG